jgi:formate dehydrogenase major subunit
MVTVTLDGKTIQVPEGTTVLRAAEAAGVHIPTLCDHPELTPYGGCRLCLIEVEGMRTLQPSCTFPVSDKMVVHTETEKVKATRKFVLTLIFSERNHFCPYCQVSGGDCELQNAAYQEGMDHWPIQPNWDPFPVDGSHKYLVMEHNRCILCRRCVRACSDLVGVSNLGIEERGAKSSLVADFGVPMGESSCVSCGTCLQVCPTGAIMDRRSAYLGHRSEFQEHQTVCVECSIGCGINVLTKENHIVRIEGDWSAPLNKGIICEAGRFLPLERTSERLMKPQIRENGVLRDTSWGEAIDKIASALTPLAGKKGDGVAALVSTRQPIETMYAFKSLFANCFGSDMVTSLEEGQSTAMSSKLAGENGQPFEGHLEALHTADCVMIIGEDLAQDHQVAGFFIRRLLPQGTKLIVVGEGENGFDLLSTCKLMRISGTNLDVFNGLMGASLRLGLAKTTKTLDGAQLLKASSEKTGIPEADFMRAATLIATAQQPVFVYGNNLAAQSSMETMQALVDLSQMTGVIADNYKGLVSMKGLANSLAAAQLSLDRKFELNGHQAVILAAGDEPVTSSMVERLKAAPFRVVMASYASSVTEIADVVLPVATWYEQQGHYLNADGQLRQASQVLAAPQEVLSSETALKQLSSKLGMELDNAWKEALTERTPIVSLTLDQWVPEAPEM